MLRATWLLAGALLVASLTLVAVAEATDTFSPLPAFPPFEPPPASCTITGIGTGKSVMIQAGPDSPAFPEAAPCPEGVKGTCLRWPYRFTYTGLNPTQPSTSHLFVSFDTDTTVWTGTPAPLVSSILTGVDDIVEGGAAERLLRFNAKDPGVCQPAVSIATGGGGGQFVCDVSFVTSSALVGTMTGAFRHGTTKKTCAIAGAGDPFTVPGLSEPKKVVTTTLDCSIEWTQSADGCFLAATVLDGTCVIEGGFQTTPVTNAATCTTELNLPGSCKTCKFNSFLKNYTCVTRTDINC